MIVIKTQGGLKYELWMNGKKFFFRRGYFLSGPIVKFYEDIKIGGALNIDYIADGGSISHLRTPSISDIVIQLEDLQNSVVTENVDKV